MRKYRSKKNTKKRILLVFILLFICVIYLAQQSISKKENRLEKVVNIEEVLQTDAYNYLPMEAKNYIREYYNETGIILLTEKNKEDNKNYLNPQYIEYLASNEEYNVVPSETIVDYIPVGSTGGDDLPSSFDLRNVDGKNFVTPFKNQGTEGLCWDYATNAHLESFLLKKENKSYDSSATILSEKQIDYATASNGLYISNPFYRTYNSRALSSGGHFVFALAPLLDGLGFVPKSWDDTYRDVISVNGELDPSDVFDFNNSLYEVNSVMQVPALDFAVASDTIKESYLNSIKKLIKNNGGAYLGTILKITYNSYGNDWKEEYADSSFPYIPVTYLLNIDQTSEGHAMEIIGWDDNIEYTRCLASTGMVMNNGTCPSGESVSGTGVWILKNSWGATNRDRIMYIPYESYGSEIDVVTDIGVRNWDNFYRMDFDRNYKYSPFEIYNFADTIGFNDEKLEKIKIELGQNTAYEIQLLNESGEVITTLGNITSTFPGYYTLDVSDRNIDVNGSMQIKVIDNNTIARTVSVYTSNKASNEKIDTKSVKYSIDNDDFINHNNYIFKVHTKTRNINTKSELTIKIKNSSNEYVSSSYYNVQYKTVFANTNNAIISINTDYFPKGTYYIEVCDEFNHCNNTTFEIKVDFMKTSGAGTELDPWQITNTRQFNLIRKYPQGHYILMNDLDFEYDTQNENGIFYNDGKGFIPIELFQGYLNGNGHKIKNIYINSDNIAGLFYQVSSESNYDYKRGIENTYIYNPTIKGNYRVGSFAGMLSLSKSANQVFNNNGVIGGTIKVKSDEGVIGGIAGELFTIAENGTGYVVSNLYSSTKIENTDEVSGGGLFGSISTSSSGLTIKDSEVINIVSNDNSNLSIATVGGVKEIGDVSLNNIISINNPELPLLRQLSSNDISGSFNNIYTNASNIGDIAENTVANPVINTNKNIYEIANGDYTNWTDFSSNWNHYQEGNTYRIPVLKGIEFDYFGINNEVSVNVGESVDLLSLVVNDKYNSDLNILKSCNYNLDVCNNTTDESVISVNGTTVTALKTGSTKVIVTNSHDGYIGAIDVIVGGNVSNKKRVTFNSNNGSYDVNFQEFTPNEEFILNANSFEYSGYTFVNWNTQSDGNGTSYSDGVNVSFENDITLYAIWEKVTHTITFNSNGGTGSMQSQVFEGNENKAISKNTFERIDYSFKNWNTLPDNTGTSYNDEQIISLDSDITLYAIWNRDSYYVVFALNGGMGDFDQKVNSGELATRPSTDPVKDGYIFVDWYADEELTTLFDFTKPIREATIVYAKWRRPVVTFDKNGGSSLEGFVENQEYNVGSVLTLNTPDNFHIGAPNNYEFDAYEINGARYLLNQQYTVNDDVTIKCLWKEREVIPPTESYNVVMKKSSSKDEIIAHDLNVETYINNKKELFDSEINSFRNGKDNVEIEDYNSLFTSNKYVEFISFILKNTIENNDNNSITYQYEVYYQEVNVSREVLKVNSYVLNKLQNKQVELLNNINIENYINEKKIIFKDNVKEINVEDLFIIDNDSKTYKYAEFDSLEKINTEVDEAQAIETTNYSYNYNLVTIILKEEYVLNSDDNSITFNEDVGGEFTLTITDVLDSLEDLKKDIEIDNNKVIGAYKIEVKNGLVEKHDGPFRLKIKLSDDMKKYNKYYMVYIDDNKVTKERIEFIRNGDYVEGTLEHLSEYVLVGNSTKEEKQEEEKKDIIINPKTRDRIGIIGIVLIFTFGIIFLFKKFGKIRRYN